MNANRTVGSIVFTAGSNAITFADANRLVTIDAVNEPDALGILNERSWTTHTFNADLRIGSDQTWRTTQAGGALTFTYGVDLQSNTLTLDPQNSSGSITFTGANGVITGTGGLIKEGAGTVYITGGSHTYTGDTVVNAGTFQINASNVLSDSTDLSIDSGATFQFDWGSFTETVGALSGDGNLSLRSSTFITDTSSDTEFSGTITDNYAAFRKAGTGDLTLSGDNTYSGLTYIDGGTLIAASDDALGAATYGNVIANGATLALQGDINLDESNFSLSGTGDGGTGAIRNISGDNTLTASLSFTGNTTIASEAGSLTLTNQLALSNALTLEGAGDITASGQITGSSALTKNGSGTLTLSGSGGNSFSGGFNLNDGGVILNKTDGTSALGQGSINIGDGSGAAGSASVTYQSGNQIVDYASTITINSDGLLDLNGNTESLNIIAGSGQIDLGSGHLTLGVNSGSSTFSGTIAGSGNLTKSGSGTVTLDGSGSNSFTGTTTVAGGTLALDMAGGNALNGDITIGDGSGTDTLRLDSANQIADSSAITLAAGGVLNLNNNNETVGSIASASSSSSISFGSGSFTTGTAGTTFAGAISGTGDFTLTGSDSLTLSGNNSFSGDLTVSSGTTLIAASDNALGSGGGTTTIQSGATLELTGGIDIDSETGITLAGTGTSGQGAVVSSSGDNILDSVFSLTGDTTFSATADSLTVGTQGTSPLFDLNGYDVTFNADGGDIIFEADFTDAGDVYKTGSGTLSLNHSEAYPAIISPDTDFYLQDGTTILNTYNNEDTGVLGDVTVGDGIGAAGSAVFQQGHTESGNGYLFNNLISDSSNITINSDGYWDLQGYKEIVNDVTMNGGTIVAMNGTGSGDRLDIIGTLTASGGTTATIEGRLGMNNDSAKSIVVDSGATLDINAVLSNGGFNKTGDGTLELSGANSFTGTALISDGIVRVDNNSGLGATAGGTQVLSGGQLQLDGVTIGAESLQIAGSGQNNDGSGALRALAGTSNTWGGSVLMTANARIVTATGADLTIDGNITGSGTTLDVESIGDTTFNGNNTFNTLNKTGAGTLTVTGINTYATTNVNGGTYALGASNILTNTMDVNLGASGTFNVGSYTEVIDDLNGSGTLTIASGGDLTIDQIGNSGAFTGTLNVDGILTLNGGTIGAADGSASTGTIELTAGNTLNIVDNFDFGGTLLLADNTTLNLVNDGTTFDVGTLRVTGDSVIDFAGTDIATLNIGTLEIDLGGTIYATSWSSFYDLWTATNFTGATLDERNGTTAQITFDGFTAADTIWLTYDYGANEITVPEPSTYGFLLMSGLGGLYALRRRRKQLKSKAEV
ncbi:autotransporter-associated beta strand repeat-containing protein [Actomonas aquatica]|uniref:Autotransporter-associated beta strand repeat-containing protein n=1 Tax=Actomonas aquatica TaxID=2866162 RepID=A0ABZ1C9S9_9BACT|nr:autotransporter-associated beta strand repeat-containing protein [Opitutus sp. WL0086]WRQ87983.1 autotransporter-associated beta strand repeat-containing protein [Opitutus sp. WL0086]